MNEPKYYIYFNGETHQVTRTKSPRDDLGVLVGHAPVSEFKDVNFTFLVQNLVRKAGLHSENITFVLDPPPNE